MKKRIMLVMLSAMMVMALVTGCGGGGSDEPQTEAAPDTTAGDMVSDETFATLQDNYAVLGETYNAVLEYYSSDAVTANETVEALLAQSAEVLDQMGTISQDTLTEAQAVELNNSMAELLVSLSEIAAMMETTGSTEGTMVSDETFAALQESYATLAETYNAVAEYYSSDAVETNAEIESILSETADVMNQMSGITQDSITESDALALNDTMVALMGSLGVIAAAMTEG